MKKILLSFVLFFSFLNISYADLDFSGTETHISNYTLGTTSLLYRMSSFSDDGLRLYVGKTTSPYYVRQYNLSTPFDVSTSSYYTQSSLINYPSTISFYDGNLFIYSEIDNKFVRYNFNDNDYDLNDSVKTTYSKTFGIRKNGVIMNENYLAVSTYLGSDNLEIYYTSIPYDFNNATLYSSTTGYNCYQGFDFSLDGKYFLCSKTISKLNTPYDLTDTITSIGNLSYIYTGIYGDLTPNFQYYSIYGESGGNSIVQGYNTNQEIFSGLAFSSSGEILPIQDGFTLSGTVLNLDYKITNIDIYEYYVNSPILINEDYRVLNQTGSGGIEVNLNILNDSDFTFDIFKDYEIEITFETIDGLQSISNFYTYGDYSFNAGYTEPVEEDFSFLVSGYSFFENGFSLNNFIPTPSGGKLYFEIIAPALAGTGTINITTETFLPYDVDGKGYGIDSYVTVTYPYHQVPGNYQVRVVYKYEDLVIYPFGTGYDSYPITLAESPYEPDEVEALYLCDTDEDGATDIGEALACPFQIIKYYSTKVYEILERLKNFFETIMSIGTDEVKTFSFIPSANANIFDGLPAIESQDNFLSKIYFFVKGFLFLIFLIFAILLIILLKRH